MKNNFRKAALSTICMLLVAVMSLTGATYAWFTAGQQATVSGMNVQVTAAGGGVQVREQGTSTWMTQLNLNVTQTQVAPVSSIDGENFFVLGQYNPVNSAQATVVSADKTNNNNIIVKNLEFSNPGQSSITVDLDGSNIVQSTAGGSATNDIYKAARVALIVTGSGYDTAKTYIYTPTAETWYGFKATSADFVDLNAAAANTEEKSSNLADTCLITIPSNPDNNDDTKLVKVQIVIWLEGQDADCKNANAAGAFDVTLNFKDITAE